MDADSIRAALWADRGRAQPQTGTLAPCPRTCPNAHEDRHPSCNLTQSGERVLVRCHARCSQDEVLGALRDLGLWGKEEKLPPIPDPEPPLPFEPVQTPTEYFFRQEDGTAVAVHGRWDHPDKSKTIRWRLPDGEYRDGLGGLDQTEIPLYGAELLPANDGDVWIVEGEKAADAARGYGLLAVSLPGGAAQRRFGGLGALSGRVVRLWPDNDAPGRSLMQAVEAAITSIAAEVTWVRAPVDPKGDAADYFASPDITSADELLTMVSPVTERLAIDAVRITIPVADGVAEGVFRGLMASRARLEADVAILPPGAQFHLRRRCNLFSSSGVAALTRELKATWPDGPDWANLLPRMIAMVSDTVYSDDGVADLTTAPEPSPAKWSIEGIAPMDQHSIVFGDGSSLKTVTMLHMAVHVAYGIPWLGQEVTPAPVLMVDYENDIGNWTRYVRRILDGLGLDPEPNRMLYRHARGVPLPDLVTSLRKTIEERGVGLVIVDSGGLACGGEPENSQAALGYFNAVSSLGCAAVTICHVTKALVSANGSARRAATLRPHGSNFWHQSARVLSYMEREPISSESSVVTIQNRKSNVSGSVADMALRVVFEDPDGPISFSRTDFAGTSANAAEPLRKRVLAALDVPLSVRDIAGLIGPDVDAEEQKDRAKVRSTLNRLERDGLVQKQSDGLEDIWIRLE